METQVKYSPSFAMAAVTLAPNEVVKAEAGAMVSMQNVDIETSTQGGIMKGLRRSVLGGESFFMNTFTAGPQGGEVSSAPIYQATSWCGTHPARPSTCSQALILRLR